MTCPCSERPCDNCGSGYNRDHRVIKRVVALPQIGTAQENRIYITSENKMYTLDYDLTSWLEIQLVATNA